MSRDGGPVDRVELLLSAMYHLPDGDTKFLKPRSFTSDADRYARNANHVETTILSASMH